MREASIVLAAIVLASGCTQLPGFPSDSNNGENLDVNEGRVEGKGLEVVSVSPVSSTLRPGQETYVELTLKNYHISEEVQIESIQLYNADPLEVEETSMDEACSPPELPTAANGVYPEMECRYQLNAPSREEMSGFDTRRASPRFRILYSSDLTNSDSPFKVEFRPSEDIESSSRVSESYSNGEIQLTAEADSPVPSDLDTRISFDIQKTGSGQLQEGYTFEAQPADLFTGECGSPRIFDDPLEDHAEFTCEVEAPDQEQVTRNFIFSTSYKYALSPDFSIEVDNYDET